MKRWLPGTMICLVACGGRLPVAAAPQPATPAPRPAGPAVAEADPPPPALAMRAPATPGRDSGAVSSRLATPDSAADDSTLDSLAVEAPAASLPDLPIDAHPTWDLNVADFIDQPRVQYYLDYFSGRAHDRFQIWLDRMEPFEAYARAQFAARQLPGDFVYLALIESGFSPEAVSRASAVGMWQFMLGTGRLYGLRIDTWVDERLDPLRSTDAAAHHLEDLTEHFGSHYLAAAAYNAGAGRVDRGLERLGTPDSADGDSTDTGDDAFFSLADTRLLRDETRNYVPQLIAAAIIAKEPVKYGFTRDSNVTPFSQDAVLVDGGTGLDLIARLADTTLEAIHQLNPALLRMITPPGTSYPVRVPAGSADRIAAAYDSLPPDDRHAIVEHEVKPGESVTSIARKYNVAATLIRSANRSARGRSVAPGTVLYLPVATTIPAEYLREPDPPRTTRTVVRTVVVRSGEGLDAVARRAGVTPARLRSENKLSAHAVLRPGQKLVVRRTIVVTTHRSTTSRKPVARSGTTGSTR